MILSFILGIYSNNLAQSKHIPIFIYIIKIMSYRQSFTSFQPTDLFRQSKSVSPGRLHKTRESFGPTLCLISSKNQPAPQTDTTEDKIKILMLSLEVERLNTYINQLVADKSIRYSQANYSDNDYLHRQISNLKAELEASEKSRYQQIQKLNQTIYMNSAKMAEYETQIKILTRRHQQAGQNAQEMRRTMRDLEEEVSKAKAEASRVQFNALLSSQADLKRSQIRQKNSELDRWKDRLAQFERKGEEQKIMLISQREVIDRLKNNELQLKQRYDYQLTNLKTENENLRQKLLKLQKEMSQETLNFQQNFRKQLRNKQFQIQKLISTREDLEKRCGSLQREIEYIQKANSGMRASNQANEANFRQVISTLNKQIQTLSHSLQNQRKKADKFKNQAAKLAHQNQTLKIQIKTLKVSMQKQMENMNEELEQKNEHIRKIKRKKRKEDDYSEKNRYKSLSQSHLNLRGSNLRSSEHNLKGIIADVVQLQNSNSRMAKIIENRNNTVATSRMVSYASYGL